MFTCKMELSKLAAMVADITEGRTFWLCFALKEPGTYEPESKRIMLIIFHNIKYCTALILFDKSFLWV